jgi:hypothetical protein
MSPVFLIIFYHTIKRIVTGTDNAQSRRPRFGAQLLGFRLNKRAWAHLHFVTGDANAVYALEDRGKRSIQAMLKKVWREFRIDAYLFYKHGHLYGAVAE